MTEITNFKQLLSERAWTVSQDTDSETFLQISNKLEAAQELTKDEKQLMIPIAEVSLELVTEGGTLYTMYMEALNYLNS